jgi:uncharacterized protein YdeI (BOF family)
MKKLLLATLMILTMTSGLAAEVGENDTNCAEMVQANRNANANGTVAEGADEVVTEESAESK